jgi:ATP-binding cassette, subfamily B, bacterial
MIKLRGSSISSLMRANLRASRTLAIVWWVMVLVRAVLPAGITLGLGGLVKAISGGRSVDVPLLVVALCFAAFSVSGPLHTQLGAILGDRTSGQLQSELVDACSTPPGIAHLERPGLAAELVAARDFDLGIMGPPISVSMAFVGGGLVMLLGGAAQAFALATVTWWGAIVIGAAWLSTHWLLRGSSFWAHRGDSDVQQEQRHADYAYRLAVDAAPAKEIRVFGVGGWVVDRFAVRRMGLLDMQWKAMELQQRSLALVFAVLGVAHAVVLIPLFRSALSGGYSLSAVVVAVQAIVGVAALGVGVGFSWALDAAAAPVKAIEGLSARMAKEGSLSAPPYGTSDAAPGAPRSAAPRFEPPNIGNLPESDIRFVDVGFTYPAGGAPVYEHLNLTIPAGKSLAIVGRNGVGKTTLVKLLCRLYDPTSGSVRVDDIDIRNFDPEEWRARIACVFQDFARLELSLRDNVAPMSAGERGAVDDKLIQDALTISGADGLALLDQPLSKAHVGGTDLSGGQWQRVALARAIAGVKLGAGVVILDEPTAQLDVRGEAEIFERLVEATRGCTTILISHRFSTVRHADRIVVIDRGEVVEEGSHDELMASGGRYKTMFELQAARFDEGLGDLEELEELEDLDVVGSLEETR